MNREKDTDTQKLIFIGTDGQLSAELLHQLCSQMLVPISLFRGFLQPYTEHLSLDDELRGSDVR